MRRKRDSIGSVATIHAFTDNNANGFFDRGDEPIPDIVIKSAGQRSKPTNTDGKTTIYNLPPHYPISLSLDPSETTNPFLFGLNNQKKMLLNEGNVAQVKFALVLAGEILGTVFVKRSTKNGTVSLTGLANVPVEVVVTTGAQKGEVIAETRTIFNGSYIFSSVPIGKSQLRIAPDYLKRANMRIMPAKSVTMIHLEQTGDYVEDADLVVETISGEITFAAPLAMRR